MESSSDVHSVLGTLQQSETLGEKVLRDRSELVQLDRIRQKNREALTALKRYDTENDSIYLCFGSMFLKKRIPNARQLIQDDQRNIEQHMERLRKTIQGNVEQIQLLEGKAETMAGFNLKPLNPDESKSFGVVLDSIKKLNL